MENEDDYKQISDRNLDGDDGLGEYIRENFQEFYLKILIHIYLFSI